MENKKNLPPTIIFIFGGSGDLTNRKLIPALYNLYLDNYLPEKFVVVGVGRTTFASDDEYRDKLLEGVQEFSRRKGETNGEWKSFAKNVSYHELDLLNTETYDSISTWVSDKAKEWNIQPNVIFYLAVAPQMAPDIAVKLSEKKLCLDGKTRRIVFEKPFGHDLQSARELNRLLATMFEEDQIYRIDHYLGKETVQNILAFRFANALFEPVWNCNYIDHVQITAAETVGIED